MSGGFVNTLSVNQSLQSDSTIFACPSGLTVGEVVYVTAANAVDAARSDNPATMPAIGTIISKPTPTTAVVIQRGVVGGYVGLVPGSTLFVSSTVAGGIQTFPGPDPQQVGMAISTTQILFGVVIGTGGGGGGATTGPTSNQITVTSPVSGVASPGDGLVGTDIDSNDFPHGSTTGQKFEWVVPDDYFSGNLQVLALYGMSTAVAGPNNVVRIQTKVSLSLASSNTIDEATYPLTASSLTVPTAALPGAGSVASAPLVTINSGTFQPGDCLTVTVERLGADPGDLHTGLWQVMALSVQYTAQNVARTLTQYAEIFDRTSLPTPTPGIIGTDIDTTDYVSTMDTEQKVSFLVPASWDQFSDAYLRLDYAIGSAVTGAVQIQTSGQIADVEDMVVTTLVPGSVILNFPVAPTPNAPGRSTVAFAVPASLMDRGNEITLKIRRVTSVGGNLAGTFRLINATLTFGQGPSTVTQANVVEEYLSGPVFGNAVTGVAANVSYPIFVTDFERLATMSSTVASGRVDACFEGRLGLLQTKISQIRVFVKGSGPTRQYRLKVYVEGSGGTPVYDSGLQTAPASITELSVLGPALSAQPSAGSLRFYVVIETYANAGDQVQCSVPFVKQE